MTTAAPERPPAGDTSALAGSSRWTAPSWAQNLYSKFPLVNLEQEDELEWKKAASNTPDVACSLWIEPPSLASTNPHHRPWASSSPPSLRTQLLFLLREPPVRVRFTPWKLAASAPGEGLPALHLVHENKLVPTSEIRAWLDAEHPLKGKNKELQGMPSQAAYDKGVALAQLILGSLYPAYLASLPQRPSKLHLMFPVPPPLIGGLITPLPTALTGDQRQLDIDEIVSKGVEAIGALDLLIGGEAGWALGAERPTPLDALIAAHLYPLYELPKSSPLKGAVPGRPMLADYLDRVLERASANVI